MPLTKIGTDAIEADAITAAKIAAGAVDTSEIATDAVTATEIAANAVDTAEIATDAVDSAEIAADAVTASEIAANAVTTSEILDANVTLAKIADQAAGSVIVRDAGSSGVLSGKVLATTEVLIGNGTGFTAAALSGDVTMSNAGAVTIATDAVDIAMLSATGTASATTFLRGDNAWSGAGMTSSGSAPAGPSAGDQWWDSTNKIAYVSTGSSWIPMGAVNTASGGTETTYTSGGSDYKVHSFTASGTFTVTVGGGYLQADDSNGTTVNDKADETAIALIAATGNLTVGVGFARAYSDFAILL